MTIAHDIYQAHLDVVSDLQWRGDLDAVLDHMLLPKRIETADSVAVMENAADMRASLGSFHASMHRLGANAYHRVCLKAEFAADDSEVILGVHRTYIMRGGQYVVAPYKAEMTLRRIDGQWRSASIRSGLRNALCTVISPSRPSRPAPAMQH